MTTRILGGKGNRTRRSQKASCRATTSRRPPTLYERSHTRKVNLCIIQGITDYIMIPNTGLRHFPLISKTLLLELRTAPRDRSNPGEQPLRPSADGWRKREPSYATIRHPTGLQGLGRCETVLQYRFNWRHLYAMLIGDAHVSTEDQDTVTVQCSGYMTVRSLLVALGWPGPCSEWD